MKPEEKLIQLKNKVESLKSEKARHEGELVGEMKRLKHGFNIDSVDMAEKKLKIMVSKHAKLKETFDSRLVKLEEEYEW